MFINNKNKNAAKIVLGIGVVCIITALSTGCGKTGPQGDQGVQGSPGNDGSPGTIGPTGPAAPTPSPSPTSTESAVQVMVDNENSYRASVGQEPLTQGLVCTLYTVPNTTTGITATANGGTAPVLTNIGSFQYLGVFDQVNAAVTTGLNVLPTALENVYQTYFVLKCTGNLVVSDSNWHQFDLNSDDGSNLYVDGLLINNDGLHGQQDKSASKYLKYGFHSFELDFFQAGGQETLILNEDNQVMQATGFYH